MIKFLSKDLYKRLEKDPFIIVMMDGGLSSQMYQYLLGQIMKDMGYKVKYDIEWFEKSGKDMDGNLARNFDLLKAFSDLECEIASKNEISFYKKHFFYTDASGWEEDFRRQKPPAYFGGYYNIVDTTDEAFQKHFTFAPNLLDANNELILEEIKNQENPVGVHVRRGDMAQEGYYWDVLRPEYFINAIDYMCKKIKSPSFYFFSDEPDWVRKEILPKLDESLQLKIVDINGSNKGYLDLLLCSSCKHQISSQGSFGKYAGILNKNPNKIVVMNSTTKENVWTKRCSYVTLLSNLGVSLDEE